MSSFWRHSLRRARFALGGLLAAAIIAVAALLALGQLLLPLAAHYPREVASLLSAQMHQPVKFRSMQGQWQASGPLLTLHDVTVGGNARHAALHLPRARVKFDLGAWLSSSRHLVNLRLSGMRLGLRRDADGSWHVSGFGHAGHVSHRFSVHDLPGNLWMQAVRVDIDDVGSGRHFTLQVPALRVTNGAGRLRFSAEVRRAAAKGKMQVIGHLQPERGSGEIYAVAKRTDLGALLHGLSIKGVAVRHGQGTMAAWLWWRHGRLWTGILRSHLRQLNLDGPGGDVTLPAWDARVRLRLDAAGTHVFYDAHDAGAARVRITGSGASRHVWAVARRLDLAPLRLLSVTPSLPRGAAHWLAASQLGGHLLHADAEWNAARGLQTLDAQLRGVRWKPVGVTPGLSALDATVRGDEEAVSVELPAQVATLRMPGVFRQPIRLQQLGGSVTAWHAADGWDMGSDALTLAGDGYAAQLRGRVKLPGSGKKPFVDLALAIDHAKLRAAKLFWPRSMPPKTLHWLDTALQGGNVTAGRVVVHGDLGNWPFRDHRGHFEAQAVLDNARLKFNPAWPAVQHVDAVARFLDDGMQVTASNAQSHGVKVDSAVAAIADFSDAQLLLHASGSGSGADLIGYVRNSPVAAKHADAMHNLSLSGSGTFDFSLMLPFKHHEDTVLAGTARLKDVDATNPDWHLALQALHGQLAYDMHGLHADDLHATFRGAPVDLRLALGAATGDPAVPVRVGAQGMFAVPTLLHGIDALAPLTDVAHGKAPFDIAVEVRRATDGHVATQLHVHSDLVGMQLDLPKPLHKPADQALPLALTLGLPMAGNDMQLTLGPLQIRARLPGSAEPLAMAVHLGTTMPQTLPTQGIRISGHTPVLDLSGWGRRALALAGKTSSGRQVLKSVDLQTDQALLFGEHFQALRFELEPAADTLALHFTGPAIQGVATLPTHGVEKRGITAQFKRLYWPSDKSAHHSEAGHASSPTAVSRLVDVAPSAVPPLHFWVGDLRLGEAHLGQARFESWPTAKGMHIDQLRTHSPAVQLSATGDWNGSANANQTHLVIDFGARNLGHMLSALGFSGLFDGGRTQDHLDATWPGPPSAASLARMTGSLEVDVSEGRIPEVNPGMGRLFGLMSVTELPRRLSLDFGGAFGKGLGFDTIKGTFRLADGNAYTDGLHLSGSVANITVTGRIGLRARDYDQRVQVTPHVGNSLPIMGALAGGPIGAAAGLAIQGLLGNGLNRAVGARYSITGSWGHPHIALISKTTLPQPAVIAIPSIVIPPAQVPDPRWPAPASSSHQ